MTNNTDRAALDDQLRALVRDLRAKGVRRDDIRAEAIAMTWQAGRIGHGVDHILDEVLGPRRTYTQEDVARDLARWQVPESWRTATRGGHAMETVEQARHRRRGERLAKLLGKYGEQLRPALVELLREPVVDIVREVLTAELSAALDVLRPRRRKGRRA